MKKIIFIYYLLFNIIIASFLGIYLYNSYNQKKSTVILNISQTSLLISELIKSSFSYSDNILKEIVDSIDVSALKYPADDPIEFERISKFIDKKRKTFPHASGVGLNDENCIMTHTPSIVGFDASNREWCSIPMNNPDIQTYVSNMFISNKNNEMMVIQTRKFPNNKGLAGIGVNLAFFSQWLNKVKIGPNDVIAIADHNLKLLARQPNLPNNLGKKIPDSIVEAFVSSNKKESIFSEVSPLDNKERLYHIQKVENLPFLVIVGEADVDWMDSWYKQLIVSSIITILLWIMGGLILRHYIETIKQKKEFEKISVTDNLTDVFNRHKLNAILKREFSRSDRISVPFGIIILDIDLFKNINDKYGHNVGDTVLKEISSLIQENIRDSDILGRWGGEEFLVIIPKGDNNNGKQLANKLRLKIEKYPFSVVKHITASFGVATYKEDDSIDSLIKRADDALYRAKEKGRNRVES